MGLDAGVSEALTRYLKHVWEAKTCPPADKRHVSVRGASSDPGRVCCFMDAFWVGTRVARISLGDLPQILSHEDQTWRPSEVGCPRTKAQYWTNTDHLPSFSFPRGEVPVEATRPYWACLMSCGHGAHAGAMAPGQRGVQRQSCSVCHPPLIKCYHGLQGQGQTLCVS